MNKKSFETGLVSQSLDVLHLWYKNGIVSLRIALIGLWAICYLCGPVELDSSLTMIIKYCSFEGIYYHDIKSQMKIAFWKDLYFG